MKSETRELGGVARVFNGKTPPKTQQRTSGHPVLKIRDVDGGGKFVGEFRSFVDEELAQGLEERQIGAGDTLILNAAHNADYVGSKTYRAEDCVVGALATGEWLIIRPDQRKLDSLFAYFWIQDGTTRHRIRDLVRGIHLYPRDVQRLEIPLPPLPEQRRIAAILDRADAIRRKRQESIHLTEDLLRSTFLEMFGDPVTNPKGWETQEFGSLATFVGGGTPSRKVPDYYTGDICWATSKDMKGEVLRDSQEHITEEAIERSATKLVPPGTLLVVVKSKILMHRLPVLLTAVPTCFGQDLKGIRLNGELPPRYVARHMRIGQFALLGQARGVNTEGLTLEHLRNYRVMRPPESLVRTYEGYEQKHAQTMERLVSGLEESGSLFSALTQRAFRGEL